MENFQSVKNVEENIFMIGKKVIVVLDVILVLLIKEN